MAIGRECVFIISFLDEAEAAKPVRSLFRYICFVSAPAKVWVGVQLLVANFCDRHGAN